MKSLIALIAIILTAQLSFGQGIGIGTSMPAASAKLEVSSTTQGMLVPRMSTAQRTAISNPASGLLVFDLTTNSFWFKGGTAWVELIDSVNTEVHRNGADKIYMGMTDSVGVGTNVPAHKLQVKTGDNQYGISHTNGTVNLVTHVVNSTGGSIGTKSNHPFHLFSNNGGNQFTLTPLGNVGIGTAAPNAPLQFANVLASRKIVLFENGNNDNQYFGFGINPSALRYQAQGDHVFYFGVDATSSNELMRLTSGGNVGIGVDNPSATLEIVHGTAPLGTLVLWGSIFYTHFNSGTSEDTHITGGKAGSKVLINEYNGLGNVGIGISSPLQKLHVGGSLAVDNKVGIGNSDPHAPLQFSNGYADRKIVLYEGGNNDHQYFGFGVNSAMLRYQAQGDHVFYYGQNSTMSNELMRITYGGRVGIGISNPQATLEIIRGTAPFGNLQVDGTNFNSHFNYGTPEDTYIRGGKPGAKVIINDYGDQGNVGIGTPNPLQKLHVGGSLAIDNKVGISNSDPHAPLQFSNGLANRKIVLYEEADNDNQYFGFGVNGGQLRYQSNGDHTFFVGQNSAASSELMRIKNAGNVGIGVANPVAMLEIARGTAAIAPNGSLQINGTTYASHFSFGTTEDTYIRGGKSGSKVIINDYGDFGNVGIGTDSPEQKLHVNGNVAVSGNLGVGISNPAEKLEVNGNVDIAGTLLVGVVLATPATASIPGLTLGSVTCNCPPGTAVMTGGFHWGLLGGYMINSYPSSGSSWTASAYNSDITSHNLTAYALCARIGD